MKICQVSEYKDNICHINIYERQHQNKTNKGSRLKGIYTNPTHPYPQVLNNISTKYIRIKKLLQQEK